MSLLIAQMGNLESTRVLCLQPIVIYSLRKETFAAFLLSLFIWNEDGSHLHIDTAPFFCDAPASPGVFGACG